MRSHGGDAAGGTVRLIVARPRRRLGNVPAEATSFVGRRRELAETRRTLAGARLVSLVGPGGVGKTRLAVRLASDLQRGFADGAWWVDLAEIRDATLVTNAVVAALDLRDQAGTRRCRSCCPRYATVSCCSSWTTVNTCSTRPLTW